MKTRFFLIFILLITITSCSKKIDYELEKDYFELKKGGKIKTIYDFPNEYVLGNGILYFKGVPFSGQLFKNYENGNVEKRSNYKDGKLYGLSEIFYEDGKYYSKKNFIKSELSGLSEKFYQNGNLEQEIKYGKNNDVFEFYKKYYENGKLIESLITEGITKNEQNVYGKYESFNEEGNSKGFFKGNIHKIVYYPTEIYYPEGQILKKLNVKFYDDRYEFHGLYQEFYSNNKVYEEGNYYYGEKDGLWIKDEWDGDYGGYVRIKTKYNKGKKESEFSEKLELCNECD